MAPAGGFGLGLATESGPQEVDEEDVAEVEDAVVDVNVGEDVMVSEDEGDETVDKDEEDEYALPL